MLVRVLSRSRIDCRGACDTAWTIRCFMTDCLFGDTDSVPFCAPWGDSVLDFGARALPSVPIGLGATTVVFGAIEETSL